MAKVFLKKPSDASEDFIILQSAAQVFGSSAGNESVRILDAGSLNATNIVTIDANVETITLGTIPADVRFSATGNVVSIYKHEVSDSSATDTLIATITIQDDTDGTAVLFRPQNGGTDVDTTLAIVPKTGGFDVKLGDQVLSSDSFTTVTPPVTEAPAFEAVSLDSPAGTPQSARVIDAQDGAYLFGDDVLQTSFTRIENFGADDAILFANLGDKRIAVSNDGADVNITVNDGLGHVSQITVVGVTNAEALIGSVSAFNALAVGDILN